MSAHDAVDGSSTGIAMCDHGSYSRLANVAYWHLADFRLRAINVRLDSKSGRQIWLHSGLSVEQGFNGLRGA